MEKFLQKTFETCNNKQENVPSTSNVVQKQKIVERPYTKNYIQYGFSWCGSENAPKPLGVICGEQLENEAMVRGKLMCHLNRKHAVHARENKNYFQQMLSQNKKQECFMKLSFTAVFPNLFCWRTNSNLPKYLRTQNATMKATSHRV